MEDNRLNIIYYKYAFLFILVNAFFIYTESIYFALIPLILAIILSAFFALDKIILFIVFFVPVSIPLREFVSNLPIDFYIPTEPLIVGVLLVFILKILYQRKFERSIIRHPVTIAIFANLIWIFVTCMTSSMPVVSFKFLAARLWFIVAFYLLGTLLFRDFENTKRFIWLYVSSFIIVIFYTLNRQWDFGLFNQEAANFVVNPFFSDHTSYGAMLAMFLPVLFGFATASDYSSKSRFLIWVVIAIFITAFVFSYTRAAWLSFASMIFIWLIIKLKLKFSIIILLITGLVVVFFIYKTDVLIKLSLNKQDSSKNMEKHLESMANVSTDASNLERLNRWSCALRMFAERPVFGWGPGTYMFQYAPFQRSYEKTYISTNAANRGNAHSEYIGPLAESGFLGTLTFLAILATSVYTALKVYRQTKIKEEKMLSLCLMLGLFTYFIHGFLNNFLDTDKASVPFWGFIAMIVAMDVFHKPESNKANLL
ncbi:MAG: O-antigen ligase family protein [Bacteroidia bacterium]|nr:O-antigen ligase family protein [Bacteroidia bacterium]